MASWATKTVVCMIRAGWFVGVGRPISSEGARPLPFVIDVGGVRRGANNFIGGHGGGALGSKLQHKHTKIAGKLVNREQPPLFSI